MQTADDTDFLTADQLAERFGVRVEAVRRWARNGCVPCFRPSRRVVRFRLIDVMDAVRCSPRAASPASPRHGVERQPCDPLEGSDETTT